MRDVRIGFYRPCGFDGRVDATASRVGTTGYDEFDELRKQRQYRGRTDEAEGG